MELLKKHYKKTNVQITKYQTKKQNNRFKNIKKLIRMPTNQTQNKPKLKHFKSTNFKNNINIPNQQKTALYKQQNKLSKLIIQYLINLILISYILPLHTIHTPKPITHSFI